ncbi:MAG: hypothetical protein A3F68_11525 [Acidobacteria bacterium RIFCSPLOWO2_12_FULL_54_10]|nr:MAG: hypothetical protein A3F68_11525 [Acidobacteria bacterium RIFCSPLOWO2_12_FULL_54_10]
MKATLYPIYWLADTITYDVPFNRGVLPFQIIDEVAIEDVSPMFNDGTFAWVTNEYLSTNDLKDLRAVRYALVHRYETDGVHDGEADDVSEKLVKNLVACLRLIRPMRQRALLMRGDMNADGTINVRHFVHPINLLEVPEVQKLFMLRDCDAEMLREVSPEFLRGMNGEFWKFRMAVEFHEAGHFQDLYWKARYLLWCSALESIYTSNDSEHRGSPVAKERIKWFLGDNTSIYETGDIPSFMQQKIITISQIIDDVYRVRNFIAHGDRIPDEYFQRTLHSGLNGGLNVLQVLLEGVSFIVRKSLLRIIQDELLNHFANPEAAEIYFADADLTLSRIRARLRQPEVDAE